jgi:hypothetical protein
MSNDRLYRPNIYYALAELESFANPSAPTTTELNSTNGLIFNITCALDEGNTDFNLGVSDVDSSFTFCSVGASSTPTLYNPTVKFTALLDKDRTAVGVFNGARDRMAYHDENYFAIERVGKASDQPFAVGDRVSLIKVKTDNPVWIVGSKANASIQQSFLANNFVNFGYKLLT